MVSSFVSYKKYFPTQKALKDSPLFSYSLLFDLSHLNLWSFLNITYGEMSSKFIFSRFIFISFFIQVIQHQLID